MILVAVIKGRPCILLLDKDESIEEAAILEFDEMCDAVYSKTCWEGLLDD
jgi:hypothetical protein